MEQQSSEKRADPRGKISAEARIKHIHGQIDFPLKSAPQKLRIINISTRGIGVITETELDPGTVLEVEMDLEVEYDKNASPVKTLCVTQWSKGTNDGVFEAGLDFIVIKDSDFTKILHCVANHRAI